MNYRTIVLLSCLVLLMACRKHEDPEPVPHQGGCAVTESHYLDDSLMKFFLFKKGSYWIYADSTSGSTDSVYCSGSSKESDTYTVGPGMPGQGPCIHNYTYITNSIDHPKLSPYKYYIQDRVLRLVEPYGSASVYVCSNINGKLTGTDLFQYHASITIHSQPYSDVYEFPFKSQYWLYRNGTYYIKPGLGIIKIVLYSGFPVERKVLELLRYKVI